MLSSGDRGNQMNNGMQPPSVVTTLKCTGSIEIDFAFIQLFQILVDEAWLQVYVTCSPVINLTVLKDGLLWLQFSNQVNKSIQIGGVFLAGFQTAQAYR
jgi:hypothetical protein